MATDTRDRRATATVECPRCGAKPGEPCQPKRDFAQGRPWCHSERRAAWLDWKRNRQEGL